MSLMPFRRAPILLAFALALASPPPVAGQDDPAAGLFLTNARLLDTASGEYRPAAIHIRGDRVAAVLPAGSAPPFGADVIDLAGRAILPGLADMHVHTGAAEWPLYVANGVTTIRVMMGTDEMLAARDLAARDADAAAGRPAPRVFLAGPLLAGEEVPWPHERVNTPAQARQIVRDQAAAGYDFIKVYDGLGEAVYAAIVDEAGKQGLPVTGHVPAAVGLAGVVAAGQHTIEHVEQAMYAEFGRDGVMTLPFERVDEVVERLAGSGVFVTPTLAAQARIQLRGTAWHEGLYGLPEMAWADPSLAGWWSMGRGQPPSPGALERRRHFLTFQQRLTAALHAAGVTILAGTDTPYPLLVPGFALHHELGALVEAGLSPLDAIRAATVHAARALGMEGDLGTVRAGAAADLLIVDGDPLEDLTALRRPWAVVSRGVFLDRDALDRLLDQAAPGVEKP